MALELFIQLGQRGRRLFHLPSIFRQGSYLAVEDARLKMPDRVQSEGSPIRAPLSLL